MAIESGVVAEGSFSGVMDGRRYNRGVRFHKLMYEALMRLVWKGFRPWIAENHEESKDLIEDSFQELDLLYNDICEKEFRRRLASSSYSKLGDLFKQ